MIEQWQPAASTASQPDLTTLSAAVSQLAALEQSGQLEGLDDEQSLQLRSWTQLSEADWQALITSLNAEQALQIATFYVVAETKLPGWECGERNPAIWIFRYLKKNKQLPEKHIIKELKSKTDNRFIPYGNALL